MQDWKEMIGKTHTEEWTVTPGLLASGLKSGSVEVFATPYMIALMEHASLELVQPWLPEGVTTVGSLVYVTHVRPTLLGMTARAVTTLTETDGRRFVFRVEAYDDAGLIGEGVHERCSVKRDKFMANAAARRDAAIG